MSIYLYLLTNVKSSASSPVLAMGKQFLPEDSTLGDFAGLSPAGVSCADPKVVASELGHFGLV